MYSQHPCPIKFCLCPSPMSVHECDRQVTMEEYWGQRRRKSKRIIILKELTQVVHDLTKGRHGFLFMCIMLRVILGDLHELY